MSEGQGNLTDRYNPRGEDPLNTFSTWDNQNYGKGLDFSGRAAEKRAFNYDMMKMFYQNNFNEYMWNKENLYNSTQQQLKRWLAAGGNANAFFGGGTNTGNASSITSSSPGSGAPITGMGMGSLSGTMDNVKSFWESRKTKAEAEGKEIENGTLRKLNEANIDNILEDTRLKERQGIYTNSQARQIESLLPGLIGKTNAEIAKLREETNNLITENSEIRARTKNLREDTRNKVLENEKLQWDQLFRDEFGVDPSAQPIQMLIQNILNGKGTNVLQAILDYAEEGGEFIGNEFQSHQNKKTKAIKDRLLFGNPGLLGVGYGIHKRWKRARE